MNNIIEDGISFSVHELAKDFIQRRGEGVDYFLKYGTPFEKTIAQAVVDLAEGVP